MINVDVMILNIRQLEREGMGGGQGVMVLRVASALFC
jgi:hypothetical protein